MNIYDEKEIRRTGKRSRSYIEQSAVLSGFPVTPAYKKKIMSMSDTPASASKNEYVVWSDSPLGRQLRKCRQNPSSGGDEIEGFAQRLARAGTMKSPLKPNRRRNTSSPVDITPLASWLFPQCPESKPLVASTSSADSPTTEADSNQRENDDEDLNNILDEMDAAYTEAENEYHLLTTPNNNNRRRHRAAQESPDVGSPFTEHSWNLLEQLESAASQRLVKPTPQFETDERLDVVDFDSFDDLDLEQLEREALAKLKS